MKKENSEHFYCKIKDRKNLFVRVCKSDHTKCFVSKNKSNHTVL